MKTAKMYQHFAVATIGITAVVGILADGEAQMATAAEQAAEEERLRVANEEALSDGNRRKITGEEDPGTGSFGSSVSMGVTNTGYSSSTAGSVTIRALNMPKPKSSRLWERLGLSKEQWDELSDEDKEKLTKQFDPAYAKSESERLADMRRMTEVSRLRAGGGASSDSADSPDALN